MLSYPRQRNEKLKIIVFANTSWYLYNFRQTLMVFLKDKGYEVIALAPLDDYSKRISSNGIRFIPIEVDSKGTNPIKDFILFLRLYRIFKDELPSAILTYTPKPNIYASLAAKMLYIPVINNIAGLGRVFIDPGLITRITRTLYRIALRKSYKVFFQNDEDLSLFVMAKLIDKQIAERIPGSGVDTKKFSPVEVVKEDNCFAFLLFARMLWDKGVGEYVEAAKNLKEKYPNVKWKLLGFLDTQNPSAVSSKQMQQWVDEGIVNYLGTTDNVPAFLGEADCVVLPSFYREGVPRSLLEAASMAKPIITTDSVGCREVVDNGVNGYLVQPRDAVDLAEKMEQVINMPAEDRVLISIVRLGFCTPAFAL